MIQKIAGPTLKNLSKFNLKPRSISSFCSRSKAPKYNVRLAYQPDYSKTFDFLVCTFMKTEPTIVNVGGGLTDCPDPTLLKMLQNDVRSGMTLICEDFNTKCIVGAAINLNSRYSGIEYYMEMSKCCQNPAAREVLRFAAYASKESDPWNNCCIDNIFECSCVAVSPDHMRQGIAKRLIEDSWILARDLDYRLFRIDASSIFTGLIAKSYGWKCIWSIPYRRYCNEDGEAAFKNIQEPHTVFEIYADSLSEVRRYRPRKIKK